MWFYTHVKLAALADGSALPVSHRISLDNGHTTSTVFLNVMFGRVGVGLVTFLFL